MRQLDPKVAAERALDIFIFNFQEGSLWLDGHEPVSHTETLGRLEELGFPTLRERILATGGYAQITSHIDALGEKRDRLEYDIDGVYFGDDWGQQKGLIMGPEHWRRFNRRVSVPAAYSAAAASAERRMQRMLFIRKPVRNSILHRRAKGTVFY